MTLYPSRHFGAEWHAKTFIGTIDVDTANHQIYMSLFIPNSTGLGCIKRWQCDKNYLATT